MMFYSLARLVANPMLAVCTTKCVAPITDILNNHWFVIYEVPIDYLMKKDAHMGAIDVSKYGFNFHKEDDVEGLLFRRYFKDFYAELYVFKKHYCLDSIETITGHEPYKIVLASRYKVETQEQLDFLIFNSRIREWFGIES
jgi:hypothetical protein